MVIKKVDFEARMIITDEAVMKGRKFDAGVNLIY